MCGYGLLLGLGIIERYKLAEENLISVGAMKYYNLNPDRLSIGEILLIQTFSLTLIQPPKNHTRRHSRVMNSFLALLYHIFSNPLSSSMVNYYPYVAIVNRPCYNDSLGYIQQKIPRSL